MESGTKLGHYTISSLIGKGGMGEVYQAKDEKLGRQVAIKVLPEEFARDADRVSRFRREAQLLAALNHPNIAAIHGLEETDGKHFLVLELVEGPTLADRIKQGPILVEETLKLALQIADALEAAHEKGVIHRDLKPANIKVTENGKVKVLDFGLAKAFEGEAGDANLSQSPTLSMAATQQGIILGTAAYMSPEQAKGRAANRASDIWAFGAVLFEMLTSRPAFEGDDISEILASVIKGTTDLDRLPARLNPSVRKILGRCLEKDTRKRFRDIGDVSMELTEALEAPLGAPIESATAATRARLPWVAVALLAVSLAGVFLAWAPWRAGEEPVRTVLRVRAPVGGGGLPIGAGFAVSPNGRYVAVVGPTESGPGTQLWLWELDSLEARPLAGTNGAESPFWSPDGRSLAFRAPPALKRIEISGGPPTNIVADVAFGGTGGNWSRDGMVVIPTASGLGRVPAAGGELTPVVAHPGGGHLDLPVFLPDGLHFLYLDHTAGDASRNGIFLGSLDAGADQQAESSPLLFAEDSPMVVDRAEWEHPRIVYWRDGSLLAQPFDLDTLSLAGEAVPVAGGVSGGRGNGRASASADGSVLLYIPGSATGLALTAPVWVDREGREETIAVPPRAYVYAQVSPDGTQIALDSRDEDSDIWIWDVSREALRRFTFGAATREAGPIWSPDGRRVAFVQDGGGGVSTVFLQAADGSGSPAVLMEAVGNGLGPAADPFPEDFSPDGRTLFYRVADASGNDVGAVATDGSGSPTVVVGGAGTQMNSSASPDGRWLAYESDESGRLEVHVRTLPDTNRGHWQVTNGGGTRPHWSRDGSELFYFLQEGDGGTIMSVPVDSGEAFAFGSPRLLFRGPYRGGSVNGRGTYDVGPDGRFLMLKDANPVAEDSEAGGVAVILLNGFGRDGQVLTAD
jgi:Tol biopolymer transport system component